MESKATNFTRQKREAGYLSAADVYPTQLQYEEKGLPSHRAACSSLCLGHFVCYKWQQNFQRIPVSHNWSDHYNNFIELICNIQNYG